MRYYLYLSGGLGNQLYQLAYLHYLSKQLGRSICVINRYNAASSRAEGGIDRTRRDLYTDLIEHLGVRILKTRTLESFLIYRMCPELTTSYYNEPELEFGIFKERLADLSVTKARLWPLQGIIAGWFQASRYIQPAFIKKVRAFVGKYRPEQASEVETSCDVAIHIRRGDFLSNQNTFNIYGYEHYKEGLERLSEEQPIGKVFMFSDDFKAVLSILDRLSADYNIIPVQGLSVLEDLSFLTSFRSYVLGNSTFSWWGAFLSDHDKDVRVIVPKQPLVALSSSRDLYPPHWTTI